MAFWLVKNWKLLTAAGAALAIVGFGLGAWWFIDGQVDARRDAEARAAAAEQTVADLEESAIRDANQLVAVNNRLDAEIILSEKRMSDERAQRQAAEARSRKSQGLLNELRARLDSEAAACSCGIGPDLTERLRLDRAEREARGNSGN